MENNKNQCFFIMFIIDVDGKYSPWSDYSNCSNPCGIGIRNRTRKCDSPAPKNYGKKCLGVDTEIQSCNGSMCPGRKFKRINLVLND